MANFLIRPAMESDVSEIYAMIRELARFERMEDHVVATEASTHESLFGAQPVAEALVVVQGAKAIGCAIYFHNFSTFVGRPGLYLEDVYIRPDYRRQGIGKAVLVELAKIAAERNCGRFEWSVLGWNSSAIAFYEGLGATVLQDWRIVRLSEDGIRELASRGEEG